MVSLNHFSDSHLSSSLVSTDVLHQNKDTENFYGPYAKYRQKMDRKYFKNYKKERQHFQDELITRYINSSIKVITHTGPNTIGPNTTGTNPWIFFTCGPFGSGKSHTLKYLDKIGVINLNEYVHIDPDRIKYDLPEAKKYIESEPEMAGTLLHMESTYISLLIQYILFDMNFPMIVDGSLRNHVWNTTYINWIYKTYPQYRIGIIKVETDPEIMINRCYSRSKITGRIISESLVQETYNQIQVAFPKYENLYSICIIVDNNVHPVITSFVIKNR